MNNNLNMQIKEIYLNATYPILNMLRTLVVEVHHIGSTTFDPSLKEIDILFVCKSNIDMFDYVEILTADGYLPKPEKSVYFENILIMTKPLNKCVINYIFMNEKDMRIKEILNLSLIMKKSKVLQEELKLLRDDLLLANSNEYINKKHDFFNEVKDILLKGSVL